MQDLDDRALAGAAADAAYLSSPVRRPRARFRLSLSRGRRALGVLLAVTVIAEVLVRLDVTTTHPATWVLVTHDVREAVLLGDRVAVLSGCPARLKGWVSDRAGRRLERVPYGESPVTYIGPLLVD